MADPFTVMPLRGGQTNAISFTGGVPVAVGANLFVSTSTAISGPPSYAALRTSRLTDMLRIEAAAKRVPDVLFSDPGDATFGLMSFVAQVDRHFVEHGLDALFYFLSPEGKWINIVLAHPQVSRASVQSQFETLEAAFKDATQHATLLLPSERFDAYDLQNSNWSASYILGSISVALQNQLLSKVGVNYAKGPILWMHLMNILSSSNSRGFKTLRLAFEDRKLTAEPGQNVHKHTIQIRNEYLRLINANVAIDDAILTVIDSMIPSCAYPFNMWASVTRLAVEKHISETMGKSAAVRALVPNAPTVGSICDEADEQYNSLLQSKLWPAALNPRDKQAAPAAFLLEKMTKAIDKLTLSNPKSNREEGTCWNCGKPGHRSPQCPDKKRKSGENKGKASKQPYKSTGNNAWQFVKPSPGESETMVRGPQTFYWCDTCSHWRTTHGTSGHYPSSSPRVKSAPASLKTGESANLAEIIKISSELSELDLGAWCGITGPSKPSDDPFLSFLGAFGGDLLPENPYKRSCPYLDDDLSAASYIFAEFPDMSLFDTSLTLEEIADGWMEVFPRSAKRAARHTTICNTCSTNFYTPPSFPAVTCPQCLEPAELFEPLLSCRICDVCKDIFYCPVSFDETMCLWCTNITLDASFEDVKIELMESSDIDFDEEAEALLAISYTDDTMDVDDFIEDSTQD